MSKDHYLSGREAADELGTTIPTLYAYVSCGLGLRLPQERGAIGATGQRTYASARSAMSSDATWESCHRTPFTGGRQC